MPMKTKLIKEGASTLPLDNLTKQARYPQQHPDACGGGAILGRDYPCHVKALIDADDPHDPIAAQFMPKSEELSIHPDESDDPISDHPFSPVKGVVHRYPDRVLLKLLLSCPVHCRFCFRRDQLDAPGGTLRAKNLRRRLPISSSIPKSGKLS